LPVMNDGLHIDGELRGWKAIADYLDVTVRAAQLWERDRGLPVQRFPGKRGLVYARIAELNDWKSSRSAVVSPLPPEKPHGDSKRFAYTLVGIGMAVVLLWAIVGERPNAAANLRFSIAPRPLTSSLGREFGPDLSPDGETVTFGAQDEGGEVNLFIKPIKGDSRTKIAARLVRESFPRWSPQGDTIAFFRTVQDGLDVVLLSLSTGRERVLTRLLAAGRTSNVIENLWVAWTADGEHLAVADRPSVSEPFRTVLISVASGATRPLTNPPKGIPGDSQCAFSPDGRFVAFVRYTTWS
jgi:WD40-like Beta Propeller Repeat